MPRGLAPLPNNSQEPLLNSTAVKLVAGGNAGGRNVNLEMVHMGAAYAYRQYLSSCDESAYLGARRRHRSATGSGLWVRLSAQGPAAGSDQANIRHHFFSWCSSSPAVGRKRRRLLSLRSSPPASQSLWSARSQGPISPLWKT